jgi:hypothetical protein
MSSGFDSPRETWEARFAGDDYIFGTAPNAFLAARAGAEVDYRVAAIFVQFAPPRVRRT